MAKLNNILYGIIVIAIVVFLPLPVMAATPPTATYLSTITDGLSSVVSVAIGPDGKIYVADPRRDRIQVYSAAGRLKYTATNFQGVPSSIAIDSAGNIYVGDTRTRSVMVFDSNWQYIRKLGSGDGEFGRPGDISISNSVGRIYVSDFEKHLVKIYNSDGSLYASFGGRGSANGQLNFPAGIEVDDANGELLVGDQFYNGSEWFERIQFFDLNGAFKQGINIDKSYNIKLRGITVDSLGRIYAADALQGQVNVYDRMGTYLSTIGNPDSRILRTPANAVIDSNNRLLIASVNNASLVIYGIDNYTIPVDPPDIYTLTVSKSGNGAVTGNPAGINCGTECSASYEAGTAISLSAAPSSDSLFTGWSGACSGSGACSVTMDSNKTVTASFALETTPPQLTLNQPQPSVLSPANSKMIPVTVSGSASDLNSGLKTVSYAVDDEYNKLDSTGSITPDNNGNFSFTINLQAYRDKKDSNGRVYTITVTATDKANNSRQASVTVTVPK